MPKSLPVNPSAFLPNSPSLLWVGTTHSRDMAKALTLHKHFMCNLETIFLDECPLEFKPDFLQTIYRRFQKMLHSHWLTIYKQTRYNKGYIPIFL